MLLNIQSVAFASEFSGGGVPKVVAVVAIEGEAEKRLRCDFIVLDRDGVLGCVPSKRINLVISSVVLFRARA